jgi:hypothetical protein
MAITSKPQAFKVSDVARGQLRFTGWRDAGCLRMEMCDGLPVSWYCRADLGTGPIDKPPLVATITEQARSGGEDITAQEVVHSERKLVKRRLISAGPDLACDSSLPAASFRPAAPAGEGAPKPR